MNYPFWDIDIGYGVLMAAVAVIHVFVSHFAIGGGLYLVIQEHLARKAGDQFRLEFLERLSKFFVLTTLVFGALTGVAIWFVIGLLNPAATEVLIHHFVWGWAIEWTFFVIEIAAAIMYYYGWRKMSAKNHLIIGWIYFGAAWMSLFVINGILAFMLTPGEWLQTGSFWDGFFNPGMWSSLIFRTGICVMLAGLYTLLVASMIKPDDKKGKLVRANAIWALVGLGIIWPSFYWFLDSIPESVRQIAVEAMPYVADRIDQMFWFAIALLLLVVVFGLLLPKRYNLTVSVVVMALGLIWFGQFEWLRESIRKPYAIYDYMYGNAVELASASEYAESGMLPVLAYRTGDNEADLYRHNCQSCHTIDTYRALGPWFAGTDEEFIAATARGTGVMLGNMPPFAGTEEESEMIAAHIYFRVDQRHLKDIYGLKGVELGAKVYQTRCGGCHEMGGFNDKFESLVDLDNEEYHDLLDVAEDLGEEMPAFTGDDIERLALIEYFKTLEEGVSDGTSGI